MRTMMCAVGVLLFIGLVFTSRADEPNGVPAIAYQGVIHDVPLGGCGVGGDAPMVGNPSEAGADSVTLKPIDPERISQLETQLRAGSFRVGTSALYELATLLRTHSTANLDPLVEPLFKFAGWGGISRQDSNMAENLIVRIGEPAIPFLKHRLISRDDHDRRVAAELLTRIGPADATLDDLLGPLLADSDEFVRRAAIDGLGVVGPAANPSINDLERIATSDPILSLRLRARIALIQVAAPSEVRVRELATFLEMKDEFEAGPSGEKRQSDLEHAANLAADALGEMGPKAQAATPILLVALQDPIMRHIAARTLRQIGSKSPEAVAVLIDILKNSPRNESRQAAAIDLGGFGPAAKDAIPALRNELHRDPNPGWSVAAKALGKIGGEDVVPILTKALEHGDGYFRQASIRALGDLGTLAQPAIAALEKARSKDPLNYNRAAAAEALLKIENARVP